MPKKFFTSLALNLIVFAALFSLTSCAAKNAPAPSTGTVTADPGANTLQGEITKIDADGIITVLQENGRSVFVEPQADAEITRNAIAAKVSALKVGDSVWVLYKPDFLPDFRKALKIRATGKD